MIAVYIFVAFGVVNNLILSNYIAAFLFVAIPFCILAFISWLSNRDKNSSIKPLFKSRRYTTEGGDFSAGRHSPKSHSNLKTEQSAQSKNNTDIVDSAPVAETIKMDIVEDPKNSKGNSDLLVEFVVKLAVGTLLVVTIFWWRRPQSSSPAPKNTQPPGVQVETTADNYMNANFSSMYADSLISCLRESFQEIDLEMQFYMEEIREIPRLNGQITFIPQESTNRTKNLIRESAPAVTSKIDRAIQSIFGITDPVPKSPQEAFIFHLKNLTFSALTGKELRGIESSGLTYLLRRTLEKCHTSINEGK